MYSEDILRLRQFIRAILHDKDNVNATLNANTILRITWQEIQERMIPNEKRGYIDHQLDWEELKGFIHKPVWLDVGYDSANNQWIILENLYTDYEGNRIILEQQGEFWPFEDIALYDHELFHERKE